MATPVRSGTANLKITIGNNEYSVVPRQNDDEAKLYILRKLSNREYYYIVGQTNQGYTCNCPDNVKREPKGGCKHIKALKAFWII